MGLSILCLFINDYEPSGHLLTNARFYNQLGRATIYHSGKSAVTIWKSFPEKKEFDAFCRQRREGVFCG
jgi:hypothetical protein